MGGKEPQIHELLFFAKDILTRKVHPFAWIDVGDFSEYCFRTASATEIGRRMFMYGRISINGSVEQLGVPAPSCGTVVAWTEHILVLNSRWGDRHGYEHWDSATWH